MPEMDFVLGLDSFADIQIVQRTATVYGFRHSKQEAMVRYFVFGQSERVMHVCQVTLIKNGSKYTPRLHFSIRHRWDPDTFHRVRSKRTSSIIDIKASVDLEGCHESYWELISYLKSIKALDTPDKHFSLVSKDANQIVAGIANLDPDTQTAVIKLLSNSATARLHLTDVNELMLRRRRLGEFSRALADKKTEPWWKQFFDANKWIFGYGLDYRILGMEHSQAHVGGAGLAGSGGKIADYALSTTGDVRFIVFVEIKTAETPLLVDREIRSGAWRLSNHLTDALTQTLASVEQWNEDSKLSRHQDELRSKNIRSIKPKAIIVIGHLGQLKNTESKLKTFELLRQSLHGVEIITFDELYERAKFIVERTPDKS
jgi:hypothetical protein